MSYRRQEEQRRLAQRRSEESQRKAKEENDRYTRERLPLDERHQPTRENLK